MNLACKIVKCKCTHLTRPCNCGHALRARSRTSHCKAQGGRVPRPHAGSDENAGRILGQDSRLICSASFVLGLHPRCTTGQAGNLVVPQVNGARVLHGVVVVHVQGGRTVVADTLVAARLMLRRRFLPRPFGPCNAHALQLQVVQLCHQEPPGGRVKDCPPPAAVRLLATWPSGRHGIPYGGGECFIRGANEVLRLGRRFQACRPAAGLRPGPASLW
jgi:hypothetical protein